MQIPRIYSISSPAAFPLAGPAQLIAHPGSPDLDTSVSAIDTAYRHSLLAEKAQLRGYRRHNSILRGNDRDVNRDD